MTETALNEKIDELQENNSETAHQRQKERRRLRRIIGIRKTDNLLRISITEAMLRTVDISIGALAEGRCSTQGNISNIPRTATVKDGSRETQAAVFADAGTFL